MKRARSFLVAGSLICLTQLQGLALVFVDANATGSNDGRSWLHAYETVKTALDNSPPNSEIWVATGTYYPSLGTDRSDSLTLKSGMKLYGGFTSGMASRNERDWAANPVFLSGDINIENNHSDNSDHILIGAPGTVLDGFTIKNGGDTLHTLDPDGPASAFGGGLYVADLGATSMKIANCTFSANNVYHEDGDSLPGTGYGGAVYATNSALEIANCVFDDNKAWARGGAIWLMNPDGASSHPVVISNCVFRRNFTRMGAGQVGGGAIWAAAGSLTVKNCRMIDNRSGINDLVYGDGAALYLAPGGDGSDECLVEDSVFVSNYTGSGRGGAICANRSLSIKRCTFAHNRCHTRARGGALYVAAATTATVERCVFAANSAYQNAHFFTWGLEGNFEQGQGGAIAAAGVVKAKNCVFSGNYSASTERRIETLTYTTVSPETYTTNVVDDGEGVISTNIVANGDAVIETNLVVTAGIKGGGGAFWQEPGLGGSVLESCTFAGNRANKYGGAVFGENVTNAVELLNCIVWENEAWRFDRAELDTSDELFGTNFVIHYTDITGGWSGIGSNNLDVDPIFAASGVSAGEAFFGNWTLPPTYDKATGLTTFTDDNASWKPGEHVGRFLEPTTNEVFIVCPTTWGAPAYYTNSVIGLKFPIAENTETTLSVYGDPRTVNSYWRLTPTYAASGHFYIIYDYHLKSLGGRWTALRPYPPRWMRDDVDSPCINAGDRASDFIFEPEPNGKRINLGAYGNTEHASRGCDPVVFLLQ